jgi:hypothetical protein
VGLPGFFSGAVVFTFSSPVKLVPNDRYALQPLALAGDPNWPVDGNSVVLNQPGYPGGRLFFLGFGGFVAGDLDLIFREGIGLPEPSPSLLWVFGFGIVFLTVWWRRNPSPDAADLRS